MLVRLKESEFDRYIDFAYNLSLDFSKSCYPTFADGIKTKDDFIRMGKKSFEKEEDEILLFYHNENLEGWIHYYYLKEDNYLSCCSFDVNNYADVAFAELLKYFENKFQGYDFYFGCSITNDNTTKALLSNGFKLIEDSYHNVLFFNKYDIRKESINIERVDKTNFDDFRYLHMVDEETYWTSDRIIEALDEWNIYVYYEEKKPKAAIYYMDEKLMLEIFGIDYLNEEFNSKIMYELMVKALNEGKRMDSKCLVFFSTEEESSLLKDLGFNCIDRYQCYFKKM